MNLKKIGILSGVCLGLTLSGLCRAEADMDLIYKVSEDLRIDEGTLEVWVKPEVDFLASVEDFYRFFIARITVGERYYGDELFLSLVWHEKSGLSVFGKRGEQSIVGLPEDGRPPSLTWEAGDWHHVAFSWKGEDVVLYVDGENFRSVTLAEPLRIEGKTSVVLGYSNSQVTVGEVCFSERQRSAQEIQERFESGLFRDEATLFYDSMNPDEQGEVPRSWLNDRVGEPVEGHAPGKFGYKLFQE